MGAPAQMDKICRIAKKYKLKIIEDSCQTMFARYKGKAVGSMGDIGCFSSYIAHLVVTGVGGFATTNNGSLFIKMRSLMNHGRDAIYLCIDDDQHVSSRRLKEIVGRRFKFVDFGYSYRCTELEAALGIVQLEGKAQMIRKRKQNALYLNRQLNRLSHALQLPILPSDRDHVFMLYGLV